MSSAAATAIAVVVAVFIGAANATLLNATCVPPGPDPHVHTDLIKDILSLSDLVPALSQSETNGNTDIGTLNFPGLSKWAPMYNTTGTPAFNNYTNGTAPWGNATVNNTNPESPPSTGVTRFYDFTISRGILSPDGVNVSMILINGQFPGPLIEANWGDTIQVTVHNAIEDANELGAELDAEGTALHWHGLLQRQTPWYDGVPGVQQCPIAPGSSYVYTFVADVYGSSWYHSHYSTQYSAGVAGPMIIHGPSSAEYDIDVGPVMISDWNHQYYMDLVAQTNEPLRTTVKSNNTLINGKMNYDCSLVSSQSCTPNAGLAKFGFKSNQTHLLRLINPSAEALQLFSIDNHSMTVIAHDFVTVQPYQADVLILGVGQRMDVLVEGTGNPGEAYWMRTNVSTGCGPSQQPTGLAAIYYEGADTNSVPANNPQSLAEVATVCTNDDLAKAIPSYTMTPPSNFAWEQVINMTTVSNTTDPCTASTVWEINGHTFRTDYNDPISLDASQGNLTFAPDRQVYNFGSNSSVLLYIINNAPVPHPMHLHGHSFWVLAQGHGAWDGSFQALDASNPPRRDVVMVDLVSATTGPGYVVIGYETNNPGIWPFHCHIAWHVSAGQYVNLLEHPDEIAQTDISGVVGQTCQSWDDWSSTHTVNQLDSGLRIIRS